jgi:drug/metabolite transporter (DMT)-like permease
MLKSGALLVGRQLSSLILNWRLVLGVVIYMISSVFFVKGISNGELSVLFPMVSLSYICSMVWARLFFHEELTRAKLAGVMMILVGIVFLGLSNK